jgi:hypothetical protein
MSEPKKPPIEPKLRRKWFRLREEDGRTTKEIAEAEGYDVRTVDKHIEIERQERERKEARSQVLRNAVEGHYKDLYDFAGRLDAEVSREDGTLVSLREDRMWEALKAHIPRSKLWRNLDRWERLQKELHEHEKATAKAFSKLVTAKAAAASGLPKDATHREGLTRALVNESALLARGETGLLERGRIRSVPNRAKELIRKLLEVVTKRPEHHEMQRLIAERKRSLKVIRDELAVVMLKRVVSGRCRYCPA